VNKLLQAQTRSDFGMVSHLQRHSNRTSQDPLGEIGVVSIEHVGWYPRESVAYELGLDPDLSVVTHIDVEKRHFVVIAGQWDA
jgi:hypothetical protein